MRKNLHTFHAMLSILLIAGASGCTHSANDIKPTNNAEQSVLNECHNQTNSSENAGCQQKPVMSPEVKQAILTRKLNDTIKSVAPKDLQLAKLSGWIAQGARVSKESFDKLLEADQALMNRKEVCKIIGCLGPEIERDTNLVDLMVQAVTDQSPLDYSPVCEAIRTANFDVLSRLKNKGASISDVSVSCLDDLFATLYPHCENDDDVVSNDIFIEYAGLDEFYNSIPQSILSDLLHAGLDHALIAHAVSNIKNGSLTWLIGRSESIQALFDQTNDELIHAALKNKIETFATQMLPKLEVRRDEALHTADSIEDYDALDASIEEYLMESDLLSDVIQKCNQYSVAAHLNLSDHNNIQKNTDTSTQTAASKSPTQTSSKKKSKPTLFGNMEREEWWDMGNYYETDEEGMIDLIKRGANVNERDASGRTPIFEAYNDETVDVLLKHGANINVRDKDGITPVMAAGPNRATVWSTRKASHLIERGAKVDILDNNGRNILFKRLAVTNYLPETYSPADLSDEEWRQSFVNDELDLMEYIVSKGVDVNIKDKDGRTAIFYIEHPEGVKFFQSHGADIDLKDKYGQTPLMFTTNSRVALALIAAGADPNLKDNSGKSVTDLHANHASILNLIQYPIHGLAANGVACGNNADSDKCYLSYQDLIRDLIRRGFDVNAKNSDNETPIQIALEAENFELLDALVQAGADVKALFPDFAEYVKNLSYSNFYSYKDIISELLHKMVQHGADINAKDEKGQTLLMNLWYADSDFMKRMIEDGADLKMTDKDGRNVLYYVAEGNNRDYLTKKKKLQLLLNSGLSDPGMRDNSNKSPLVTTDLFSAQVMADAGFSMTETDSNGQTPIYDLVSNHVKLLSFESNLLEKHMECLYNDDYASSRHYYRNDDRCNELNLSEQIKRLGADVRITDKNGNTVLMQLLKTRKESHDWKQLDYYGDWKTVTYSCNAEFVLVSALIDNGVDVNQKDSEGRTPLMLTQCYDTAQLLMISGANINERDNQGKTAFDYHKDDMGVLEMLYYPLHFCRMSKYDVVCSSERIRELINAGYDMNELNLDGEKPNLPETVHASEP